MYQPDEVFKFVGHYGFQSSIELAADETIQTISMGDSTAWIMQPSTNRIFLKPVEQSASTNMTVLTDKRTYLFELHAREAQDINDKDMTFIYRFIHPATAGNDGTGGFNIVKHYSDSVPLPDVLESPEKYNFRYSISGTEFIAPLRIFDDGEFTFFQFRNKNADVPAFFITDSAGNEALINYRTRGDFIVVERVAERFTLRHGSDIVCVFNEAFPLQLRMKPPVEQKRPTGG
jgi:type IV secretion system protein VirB9